MRTFSLMTLAANKLLSKRLDSALQNSERCSLFLFVLLILLLLSACQPQTPSKEQMVFSGEIMGTQYRITVVSQHTVAQQKNTKQKIAQKKIGDLVLASMQTVNQSMSNYITESELSQFNRSAAGVPFEMSTDFLAVMQEAQRISVLSKGAFDVTLAQAINAWGFGPEGEITKQPSDEELLVLRATSDYRYLHLANSSITKTKEGVEVNLSAIAKGYAVDKVAKTLESQGIVDYLINIGGEIRASGKSIDGHVWRVGIEKPQILGGIQQVALLDNKAIATSGDYRNYLVVDGQKFSHTIDPITLKPVLHKLALVSVIAPQASTADALATAMMAMGDDKAWAFAQKNNIAAYLIIRSGSTNDNTPYSIRYTKEFERNLQ